MLKDSGESNQPAELSASQLEKDAQWLKNNGFLGKEDYFHKLRIIKAAILQAVKAGVLIETTADDICRAGAAKHHFHEYSRTTRGGLPLTLFYSLEADPKRMANLDREAYNTVAYPDLYKSGDFMMSFDRLELGHPCGIIICNIDTVSKNMPNIFRTLPLFKITNAELT